MGTFFFDKTIAQRLESLQPLLFSARGSIALYTFRGVEHPALMHEVGRLREQAFRHAGGGTGRDEDIDSGDKAPNGYRQLIAWDMRRGEIVGGYRYMLCGEVAPTLISTLHYFRPSLDFYAEILPYSIEVGRSFTIHRHEGHPLFAMEALWQGLGRVVVMSKGVRYMFGKVTIYPNYQLQARQLVTLFLKKFFPSREPLLSAREPYCEPEGDDPFTAERFDDNYSLLRRLLRKRGTTVPPMINAYMRLSRRMQVFDTVINHDFGDSYETAILMPIDDITPSSKMRYLF